MSDEFYPILLHYVTMKILSTTEKRPTPERHLKPLPRLINILKSNLQIVYFLKLVQFLGLF